MTRVSYLLLTIVALSPTFSYVTNAANILGFFPVPSKSHLRIHCSIADELAIAGHNVTVMATFPNPYKHAKYNYIYIETAEWGSRLTYQLINDKASVYKRILMQLPRVAEMANTSLAHSTTQKFLHDHKVGDFDLMILGYFGNDLHLGIAAHFQCPIILSFIIQPTSSINTMLGNPNEVSYVPLLFTGLSQPMNFMDRVKNFLALLVEDYAMRLMMQRNIYKTYNLYFPADRYPSIDQMRKNISLIFTNHHFSQGPIRPNVPALIEIGGIQIKEQPDPLPSDLVAILNNATEGVIYFSLGSIVSGTSITAEKVKLLFDVLSKLPYTVLWKWSDTDLPGISENIIYRSWLPQDDLLAHTNVKLFITHGGQGSVVESQYHGVPMVCIPLFGDQQSNVANVERSGFGLSLDYHNLKARDVHAAITEVIENPKYTNIVRKFSRLYRDRPMTPRQLVVYWTEYVLRHRGAPHLQSPAVHMNRFQLLSLDIAGFLLSIMLVIIGILVILLRFICCRHNRNKTKSVNTAKKLN